jgi:hypothetical protein
MDIRAAKDHKNHLLSLEENKYPYFYSKEKNEV